MGGATCEALTLLPGEALGQMGQSEEHCTVKESDLRGLRKLASLAGNPFKMGILLYDGDETLPLGDNIWAAPLATLWGK